MPALVMNCLAPSITHSPSSRRGARARVAGVRARLGLGQPEGRRACAPRTGRGSQSLLLLLGAEQVDRLRAQRRVRAQRDRHRGVHARELLDRERVGERVAAAAAVLLGERDAHQVSSPSLAHDLVGERASCGRAPRRPARPRPRRSRARCGGSARGRRRGRSPCGDYRSSPLHRRRRGLSRAVAEPARRARPAGARPSPSRPWPRRAAARPRPCRRCRGAPTGRRRRSGAGTRRR